VSQQIHYTLHSREAEYELGPLGLDQGVSTLVWSPLAGGLLSGKYTRSSRPEDGRHVRGFKEPPVPDWERLYDIVEVINDVAALHGVSGAQVSLAWLLQRPGVASVVIGGRTLAHFEDNLKAADLALTAEDIRRLDAVSAVPLIYPYWHQSFTAADRLGPPDRVLHDQYDDGQVRG
jgi:aryl-alcohol dehydrogenase-like predicted oxidoreductase